MRRSAAYLRSLPAVALDAKMSIEWEIWIDRGERPLPRRILITSRDDPDQPQFAASFRWDAAPHMDRGRFTFLPPAGARRIEDDAPPTRDIALRAPGNRPSRLRG